jgi:sulfur relay (sulfurtransferase) complex TusBCD TusD component (DsrE family)
MLTMRLGEGIVIGSMKELAEWVAASDRIITF